MRTLATMQDDAPRRRERGRDAMHYWFTATTRLSRHDDSARPHIRAASFIA